MQPLQEPLSRELRLALEPTVFLLRKLYDARFLDRLQVGTVGAGLQPVYLAGDAAVPLLSAELDLPPETVREWIRADAKASEALLPHDLMVNDVRIALTSAIEGRPDLSVDEWLNPRQCYDTYAPGRSLRPDGYFRFFSGDLLHSFFLEVDRGTVSLPRWRAKVERYLEYREGAYEARHGLTRFRILVTTPSHGRLESLLSATRSLTDRVFWFALTEDVLERSLADAIWRAISGERKALAPEAIRGGRSD
jgi:hypothetical protein